MSKDNLSTLPLDVASASREGGTPVKCGVSGHLCRLLSAKVHWCQSLGLLHLEDGGAIAGEMAVLIQALGLCNGSGEKYPLVWPILFLECPTLTALVLVGNEYKD